MSADESNVRWVIHFSADPASGGNPHGRHHICRALAPLYRVLWVNPYGFRWPRWNRHVWGRVWRKLASSSRGPQRSPEGWVVVTPLLLPIFTENPLQSVNRTLLARQVTRWMHRYRVTRGILFLTTPRFAEATTILGGWPVITYFSDAYSRYRELRPSEQARMHAEENLLLRNSRLVFACSRPLARELIARTDPAKVIHFPHQLDAAHFVGARARHPCPPELQALPRPIVGYYGTLTDSNDWGTLRYVAERRPGYSFVLIGTKEIVNTGVEHLRNVHFLGARPYEAIPAYGAAFDVAVMFWVVRDWIRYCSPLKLREYLALGLPVVSTWIDDVAEEFGDVVAVTKSPPEFLAALDRAIAHPNRAAIQEAQSKVAQDSWDKIVPYFNRVWAEAFG